MKGTKIKLYRDLATMLAITLLLAYFLFQQYNPNSWKSYLLMFAMAVPLVNAGLILLRIWKIKKGEKVEW